MYIGVGLVQDPIKTGQVTTNISYCTDYIAQETMYNSTRWHLMMMMMVRLLMRQVYRRDDGGEGRREEQASAAGAIKEWSGPGRHPLVPEGG